MKAGSISDPIPMPVGSEQVLVILMPLGESSIPPFDEVKREMTERALQDGIERVRKQWLEELRRNAAIEVR